MNKGKTIFNIGQLIMVIGSAAYIFDLLFLGSSWLPTMLARYSIAISTATLQHISNALGDVLTVVYAAALVLMLVGGIMKRAAKKNA